jgi:homoserine/homoserine lactone efflux protein
MSIETYALFVVASALLVATPGPNVALVVGTSLGYGARTGFVTVAGVNFGLVLQLCAVAAGMSWIVELFESHFDVVRYAGAGYLMILGITQLLIRQQAASRDAPELRGERAFARGLAVAFANPKTLLFHAAFLPQFLAAGAESRREIWLLAATFAVIAAVGDGLYALFAARARVALGGWARRFADRAAGAILIGGAAILLAVRR